MEACRLAKKSSTRCGEGRLSAVEPFQVEALLLLEPLDLDGPYRDDRGVGLRAPEDKRLLGLLA